MHAPAGCRIVKIASFAKDQLLGMKVRALLLRCIQDRCVEHEHVWTIVPHESFIKDFYQSAGFGHCYCVLPWRKTDLGDEWAQLCTRAHLVDHWGIHRRMASFVNCGRGKQEASRDASLTSSMVIDARTQNTDLVLTNFSPIATITQDQSCEEYKVPFLSQRTASLRCTASGSLINYYKKLPPMSIAEERNQQLMVADSSPPNRPTQRRLTDRLRTDNLDSSVRDTFGHTAEDRKWLLYQYQNAQSREQLQRKVQELKDARNYMEEMSADKGHNSGKGLPLEVPGDLDGEVVLVDSTTKTKPRGGDTDNGKQQCTQGSSGGERKEDLPMDAASISRRIRDRALKELDRLSKKG